MIPIRYLFTMFILVLIFICLSGCGGGGDNMPEEEPKQMISLKCGAASAPNPCLT